MYKIYSRPRIRLPKFIIHTKRKIKSTKVKKMATILTIFIVAFFTVKVVLDAVLPIFDNLCENRAESIATIISNEQASKIIKKHTYDEIYTIEKDNQGNITMIKSNAVAINQIISDVANKIQKQINTQGKENIEIALR